MKVNLEISQFSQLLTLVDSSTGVSFKSNS